MVGIVQFSVNPLGGGGALPKSVRLHPGGSRPDAGGDERQLPDIVN